MRIDFGVADVTLTFIDDGIHVVSVRAATLPEAIKGSIVRFKDLQEAAIDELQKWHLVSCEPTTSPVTKDEPS